MTFEVRAQGRGTKDGMHAMEVTGGGRTGGGDGQGRAHKWWRCLGKGAVVIQPVRSGDPKQEGNEERGTGSGQ